MEEESRNEILEETYMVYGNCPYCGQQYMFQVINEPSDERLTQWCIDKCNCKGATKEKKDKKKKERIFASIDKVVGEKGTDIGTVLKQGVQMILDQELASITVTTAGGVKLSAMAARDDGVKIAKRITYQEEYKN